MLLEGSGEIREPGTFPVQVRALLTKGYRGRRRARFATLLEICAPLYWSILLFAMHLSSSSGAKGGNATTPDVRIPPTVAVPDAPAFLATRCPKVSPGWDGSRWCETIGLSPASDPWVALVARAIDDTARESGYGSFGPLVSMLEGWDPEIGSAGTEESRAAGAPFLAVVAFDRPSDGPLRMRYTVHINDTVRFHGLPENEEYARDGYIAVQSTLYAALLNVSMRGERSISPLFPPALLSSSSSSSSSPSGLGDVAGFPNHARLSSLRFAAQPFPVHATETPTLFATGSSALMWPYYVAFVFMPSLLTSAVSLAAERKAKLREALAVAGMTRAAYVVSAFLHQWLLSLVALLLFHLANVSLGTTAGSDPLLMYVVYALFSAVRCAQAVTLGSVFLESSATGIAASAHSVVTLGAYALLDAFLMGKPAPAGSGAAWNLLRVVVAVAVPTVPFARIIALEIGSGSGDDSPLGWASALTLGAEHGGTSAAACIAALPAGFILHACVAWFAVGPLLEGGGERKRSTWLPSWLVSCFTWICCWWRPERRQHRRSQLPSSSSVSTHGAERHASRARVSSAGSGSASRLFRRSNPDNEVTSSLVGATETELMTAAYSAHGSAAGTNNDCNDANNHSGAAYHSHGSSQSPPVLEVHDLAKTYPGSERGKGPTVAVRSLSFRVYPGSTFALLGKNGAGKTTAVSMLSCVCAPTGGTATAFGLPLAHPSARARTGVVPQHDVLFTNLNAFEHLNLYGAIKGIHAETVKRQADSLLASLGVSPADAQRPAGELSGGTKRKLSAACALLGPPGLLFLDEATAGMDHASKRALALCVSMCDPRPAVVATSHMLGELELADEIAIMVGGRIRHRGDAMALKAELGLGYRLALAPAKQRDIGGTAMTQYARIDIDTLAEIASRIAPGARIDTTVEGDRSPNEPVQLCVPGAQVERLPALLRALGAKRAELGITSITASAPSLEEVFLKAIEEDDDDDIDVVDVE